ncbi:conjugal transfer protein TraF, partial [Campylobacter armoricus]|uniref:conjugal transfer protein TraF n=1 Tax=Campylobacter armoricus TaxID=2505970 RepID=UPI001115F734
MKIKINLPPLKTNHKIFQTLNSSSDYTFKYNGFEKTLKIQKLNNAYALFFFTQDCGVCKMQIPILNELFIAP